MGAPLESSAIAARTPSSGDLEVAAGWLADPDNYQWLDFGGGSQIITSPALHFMSQRPTHVLWIYSVAPSASAAGLVALSDVASNFGTATLWYVLGDKAVAGRRATTHAAHQLLRHAFDVMELRSVQAWTVEGNTPSQRVLEHNGFRLIGRRRQCHVIGTEIRDRFLYDLLAGELPERVPGARD